MNKTKKLTQGAMMIAIVGALILLDRLLANWFDTIVVLIAPVVIAMYSAMYTVKDGLLVSIGILVITFLFGNTDLIYLLYIPVGVVTGIAYSIAVSKNFSKNSCLIVCILSYILGEIIVCFVVYPIMGISIISQIEELKVMMDEMNYTQVFETVGFDINKVLMISLVVSTVIMGTMEGIIIHILTVFLLKRFRIKDLGALNLWDVKPNKIVSYICFLSLFGLFFLNYIENETIYYVFASIMMIGCLILLYYGYLFMILFGRIVLHKNITGLLIFAILFFLPTIFLLIIAGFLYGSGPLRNYLEDKMENRE